MAEEQDNENESGPVAGFFRENKVGVIVASVLVVGGLIWSGTGSGETEPTAEPTISSTAGPVAPATPSASPTASPTPSASKSSTADPEPSESPSEAPSPSAGDKSGATPSGVKDKNLVGTNDQTPQLQDWEPTAEKFSALWADKSGGKQAWLKRLKPVITEDLYDSFTYTSIDALYDDTFSGLEMDKQESSYVIFTSSYEQNGKLLQGLMQVQPDGSWLVKTIAPPEE